MTDTELSSLEAAAKAASPGPWRQSKHDKEFVRFNDTVVLGTDINGELNAAYIAAANPTTTLKLISQLRACYELIEVLTKAATMTESIAFTQSYFDHTAYEEICRDIPELRQKAGLPPIGDGDD